MHQPRALDVVAIALQVSSPTCPVHLKEEVQMVGLGIQNLVCKDVDEITQRCLDTQNGLRRNTYTYRKYSTNGRNIVARLFSLKLSQTAQQVGIGFDDVQMGILRLGEVGIQLGQAHISNGPPFSGASLYITIMLLVEGMCFDAVIQVEGILQCLTVARGTCILRKTIDGKTNGIELLFGIQRPSLVVHTPVDATIFRVYEMVYKVALGTGGHVEVSLQVDELTSS